MCVEMCYVEQKTKTGFLSFFFFNEEKLINKEWMRMEHDGLDWTWMHLKQIVVME